MDKNYKNFDSDPRGPWRGSDFTVGTITKNRYTINTPSGKEIVPPIGRSWRMSEEKFEELKKDNRIYFGKEGDTGHNDEAKKEILDLFPNIEPFTTPKPERLLKRIIQIATNEGDIVLDYFVVERSMFDTHSGIICIADHALNGKLAKLVATQLEYDYQPDNEHFCGKKGDVLLAVVDGMLTEGLVNFLVNSMDKDKFLEIAALAVDPDLAKSINRINREEELRKREFEEEHDENCKEKKEKGNLNELIFFLENKMPEFRVKKLELENSFSKDYTTIKNIFNYSFFKQLIHYTYLHFRKTLSAELFPYASSYIIFDGFLKDTSRGLSIPNIFRYKSKDSFIIRQTFRISLSNKYEKELTELDSQIVGYDFLRLIKTIAHELAHCLLGDFFRVCGYDGEYTHRIELEKLTLIIEEFL
ncbi:14742_t:CDS:2 [Cetraspora pellucida]|uniref:14742_t:CDS:1 n=1 Tax=Cetraspora pellucida TaxID=1433469 RepID=A0ACA9LPW7_9GLOM|nr:14742_t:CDS:2 [Cetraspora pellucida]